MICRFRKKIHPIYKAPFAGDYKQRAKYSAVLLVFSIISISILS